MHIIQTFPKTNHAKSAYISGFFRFQIFFFSFERARGCSTISNTFFFLPPLIFQNLCTNSRLFQNQTMHFVHTFPVLGFYFLLHFGIRARRKLFIFAPFSPSPQSKAPFLIGRTHPVPTLTALMVPVGGVRMAVQL